MEIIGGIIVCAFLVVAGWFAARIKYENAQGSALSPDEIDKKYVSREMYGKLEDDLKDLDKEKDQKNDVILNLNKDLSRREEAIKGLNEKLENQKKEVEELQKKLTAEFENIANRILEQRSEQFLKTSKENISNLLNPLDIKISDFRKRVDEIYKDDTVERTNLKAEINNLLKLNQQLSEDANNLANALKGESKTQGNWGEVQLELILERVGLQKDVHYQMQGSFEAEDGRRLQPDCVINLPDKKQLIIDSKVSLTAFEKYFNAATEEERKQFSVEHLNSVSGHIKDLSKKNYQNLYQINSPDYVLLFITYESALALACRENPGIFQEALEKNIVLVTGSTLLATLKTVAYMWKQEDQKKNVLDIAKQSGALLDKFVGFVEDLKKIGASLEQTRSAYDGAMNKLVTSAKKGDSLIERAERIQKLGAQSSKALPQDILDQVESKPEEALNNPPDLLYQDINNRQEEIKNASDENPVSG